MTSKNELHEQAEQLNITSPTASIAVHALIDSERITELKCMDEGCLHPGVPFSADGGRRNSLALSLDHVQMRARGGSDRPDNIRIVHYACNCAWNKGQERPRHGATVMISNWFKMTRELQTQSFGKDPATLEGDELQDYLRMNLLAAHTELSELAQELRWKPWKHAGQDAIPTEDEMAEVLFELVDVAFFYANIAVALRVTPAEFVTAYLEKYEINELRMAAKALGSVAKTQLPTEHLVACSECDQTYRGTRGLAVHVSKAHRSSNV